jgi:hypothetical protein
MASLYLYRKQNLWLLKDDSQLEVKLRQITKL